MWGRQLPRTLLHFIVSDNPKYETLKVCIRFILTFILSDIIIYDPSADHAVAVVENY